MSMNITFLGGGNMANAIVAGLIAQGYLAKSIHVVDRNEHKRAHFVKNYGVNASLDYPAAIKNAQIIVLAIKPQGFATLLNEIKPLLIQKNAIIVSIMSGIRLETLQTALPNQAIVRAMPNTPARVQTGMTLLSQGNLVTPAQLNSVTQVFNAVGQTVQMPTERAFEELTALTGCGPAFVFYMINIFAKAMQDITPQVDCLPLALATFKGAVTLMDKEQLAPYELIAQVCPKGGMTFEAMKVLQQSDLQHLFTQTFAAAIKRGDELAQTNVT